MTRIYVVNMSDRDHMKIAVDPALQAEGDATR